MNLLQCKNMYESDIHFKNLLVSSSNIGLLGDIELNGEELKHLSKLISKELKKPDTFIKDSLSIAIFLVWMGILHYRDNFWGPVYKALELPNAQIKWQKLLGNSFIQTLKKYKLPYLYLEGKLRYIIPILAHGYVPNYYLDSYFSDVVMALYIDRKNTGLIKNLVNLDEVKHLVSNWQREYEIYQDLHRQKTELESQEETIDITLELLKNRYNLIRLNELRNKLKESDVLNKLLVLPQDWLEYAEAKLNNLQEVCTLLDKTFEIAETIRIKQSELRELNQKIEAAASQVLDYWDETLIDSVLSIPNKDIEKTVEEYCAVNRLFTGNFGWLLRLVLWWRFRKVVTHKCNLEQYLSNLPIKSNLLKEPSLTLPERLKRIQDLIEVRKEIERELAVISETEQEIAAQSLGIPVSRQELSSSKEQLLSIKNEIAEYKMRLVKLGKGNLEIGVKELNEQRSIRHEIESIEGEISNRIKIDVLLKNLHLIEKVENEGFLNSSLADIRKKKVELNEKIEQARKPLYALNESTRTFLLEGGDLSVKFIFYSMLLLQKLDQEDPFLEDIDLPSRIIRHMEKWWLKYGKNMLNEARQQGDWQESGDVGLHRPVVKLDTLSATIKVELPKQLVKEITKAVFMVQGESGTKREKEVITKRTKENQFQTESVVIDLEQPETSYCFKFICGDISRKWEVKGLDDNKIYILFNPRGELIGSEQLPAEGAYIVVPAGSRVEPDEVVRERRYLSGYWSDYEYCYLHSENMDMVLIESETRVVILKQKMKLEPRLIGGNRSVFLKSKGNAPVYIDRLPEILFTPNYIEELSMYGVRLDCTSGTYYIPLEKLEKSIYSGKDVHLPLVVITDKVFGFCKASLIYKQNVIWSEDFIILPKTHLNFDQDVYLPQLGNEKKGQLEITSCCQFRFLVYPPATLVDSEFNRALVEFDTQQQYIFGELCYYNKEEKTYKLEVCIEIPCIRWRKSESDIWRVEVEELWHEELDQIQVRLLPSISGLVTLSMEDNRQFLSCQAKTGTISFNLRQFSDSLRESNKPVHTLLLAFENNLYPSFPLVRVRTCWQVKDVRLDQSLRDNERSIRLKWEDLGKADSRIIRFWPLNMSKISMYEQDIPDNVTYLEIVQSREKFPAGMYRLQFDVDDPWRIDKIIMPDLNSENCFDLLIGSIDEIYHAVFENGLTINSFDWEGRKVLAGRNYWIEDITLSPEFEGDELLKGTVYTADEEGNTYELDYNPVSFYLELSNCYRLPFLIDRDKDGVMYCVKCKELFWEDAHRECGKRQVIFPDYINVFVKERVK